MSGPIYAPQSLPSFAMPIPYGALGHYRTNHRCALVATQAANSRLFSLRNTGTNLIVLTRLQIKLMQSGAHTAVLEDSIDAFKVTGFTADDTTNTVTPTASRMKSTMATAPGGVNLRGVTVAGAAAGMTGGTLVKDGNSIGQLPVIFQTALPTTPTIYPEFEDELTEPFTRHPVVLANNEGIIVENRVVFGAAGAASVYLDCSYAEIAAYNVG